MPKPDNVIPLGPSPSEEYALDIIEPFGEGDGIANVPVTVIKGLLADISLWRKAALLRGKR